MEKQEDDETMHSKAILCVCECFNSRCAVNGTEWKPTADPSSLGYTNKCVCATASRGLQVCATYFWGKFSDVYISSGTTERVCLRSDLGRQAQGKWLDQL